MENIPISIAAKIAEYTVAPVGQWLCYSCHYSKNMENLKYQVERLQHSKERWQLSVDAALRNGEKIHSDVNKWLTDVYAITESATRMLREGEEKAEAKSSHATCLNLKQRHRLSREANKIARNIVKHLENGNFNTVSYPPAAQDHMVTTRVKNYVTLNSRTSVVNRIMEALGDANINKIGVWGMPGVGKSTLMKEIERRAKEEKLFYGVVLAAVTKSPELSRIRGEITVMLNRALHHQQTEIRRANLQQESSTKDTKLLVILDDIWKQLELEDIGIPSEGCKVVLTSRNRDVLVRDMGSQKNFKLMSLLEEEAWYLFEKMAGDSFNDPDVREVAIEDAELQLKRPPPVDVPEIVSPIYSCIELSYNNLADKELKSLFLLCAPVGQFNIYYQDLLRYGFGWGLFQRNIVTLEEARHRLDSLVSDLQDSCLLLESSNTSGQFYMHDVVRYVATIPDTFFQGMDKLNILDLTKMQLPLLPSSLLHLRNLQTLCLDQCVLGDISGIGELKNLLILSLLHSDISTLPREIRSLVHLRLLDLRNCSKLEMIPPNIISRLVKLEELYIGNNFVQWEAECHNDERKNASLAELKHLSNLTTLEIQIPDANNLPEDLIFEKLERYTICIGDVWHWIDSANQSSRTLKLKLKSNFQLKFWIKMLLKRTENLHLDELDGVKSVIPEIDEEGFQQLMHLQIQNNGEIKHILNLRTPVIAFPTLETLVLENMISLEEICHGKLCVTSFKNLRILKVKRCNKLRYVFSSSIARGLPLLQKLEVRSCNNMGAIVAKEEEDGDTILFHKLHTLVLKDLPKLVSFLSTKNSFTTDCGEIIMEGNQDIHMPLLHHQVAFPGLKKLTMKGLPKIKHVWSDYPKTVFRFQNLQEIYAVRCESLKSFFPTSVISNLEQLKILHIDDCGIEEIVIDEGGRDQAAARLVFPRVSELHLRNLRKLKWFYKGMHVSKWPMLKKIWIDRCKKVMIFASRVVNFQETVEARQFEMSIKQPFFLVDESTFPNLELLSLGFNQMAIWPSKFPDFPPCFLTRMPNLLEFEVSHCGWKEIFPYELLDPEVQVMTFPRLRQLVLESLPMLAHLWKEDTQPCPLFYNLEFLEVLHCNKLRILVPSTVSLRNLTDLSVSNCHGLINLVTSSTARTLLQLNKMTISKCKKITKIVAMEDGEANVAITFNKLTYLELDGLPNLTNFCSGASSFWFPSLERVIVRCCPEMKTFCQGILSTPKLKGVQATKYKDDSHWEHDLNTTTLRLWESNDDDTQWLLREMVENSKEDEGHP
ncbi:hypothetical protein F2P56_035759 [Juglans regia]|uniref:AAA+ ATPase domain-containing protein n=1 Tax=Juglans regia TaxID=51240 RepID=A0A833TA19_JUGRE|nr:hypothetical protein F2P56_035759 [Juglans regia]